MTRGTTRRPARRATWLCVAAIGLTLFAPTPATARETYTVRYVVAPMQTPGIATEAGVADGGMYTITPTGRTVTVTIADDGTPEGSFLFKICQKNQPHPGDSYCGNGHDDRSTGDICYTGPTTLRRVVPGNPVEVTIWWSTSPCPDAPTTGTLTIEG